MTTELAQIWDRWVKVEIPMIPRLFESEPFMWCYENIHEDMISFTRNTRWYVYRNGAMDWYYFRDEEIASEFILRFR